jgi:hypothetical protein
MFNLFLVWLLLDFLSMIGARTPVEILKVRGDCEEVVASGTLAAPWSRTAPGWRRGMNVEGKRGDEVALCYLDPLRNKVVGIRIASIVPWKPFLLIWKTKCVSVATCPNKIFHMMKNDDYNLFFLVAMHGQRYTWHLRFFSKKKLVSNINITKKK